MSNQTKMFRVYFVDQHGKGSALVRAKSPDKAQEFYSRKHPDANVRFALPTDGRGRGIRPTGRR